MKFRFFKNALSLIILLTGFFFLQQNLMAAESEIVPPPPPPAPPLPPGKPSTGNLPDNAKPVPPIKSVPVKKNTGAIKAAPKPPVVKKKRSNRPEVTIVAKQYEVWAEYRINDILYMIKVSPKSRKSKPYYMIDQHGDGVFVRSNFKPKKTVPKWALKRAN